jgi:hypothetical protein
MMLMQVAESARRSDIASGGGSVDRLGRSHTDDENFTPQLVKLAADLRIADRAILLMLAPIAERQRRPEQLAAPDHRERPFLGSP